MESKQDVQNYDTERCPRCGDTFQCSKSKRCWCHEYDIPVDNLDLIEASYASCLCPECLKFYSSNHNEPIV